MPNLLNSYAQLKMIKSLLFLYSLVSPINYNIENEDTLAKYSYYYYAFTDDCKFVNGVRVCRVVGSTGFLYREKSDIYLISAAHSLFNLTHKGQEQVSYNYPTKFNLRLFKKGSKVPSILEFDVSKLRPPDGFFRTNPDVYAVRINIPDQYEIHSIEKFILRNEKEFESLTLGVVYGFQENYKHDLKRNAEKVELNTSTYLDTFRMTENTAESLIALAQTFGKSGKGNSGSPLFVKLKTQRFVFGGVCIANHDNRLVFVRPEDVLQCISDK